MIEMNDTYRKLVAPLWAGLTALFSCIFLVHIGIGIHMLSGPFRGVHGLPRLFAWVFIAFPAILMLCGWTLAGLIIAAGGKLRRRVSRMFCLVVAGLECILMPIGTVLGVFTIIVLARDSVIGLFEPIPDIRPTA